MTTYDDLLEPQPTVDRDHLQRLVDGWRGKQRLRHIPISACMAYRECADALAAALGDRSGPRLVAGRTRAARGATAAADQCPHCHRDNETAWGLCRDCGASGRPGAR